MIKFMFSRNSRKSVGFGLSEGNINRLKKGQPIHVNGEQIGVPNLDFLIFYGETEQTILKDLADFIGPETIIHE